MSTSSCDGASTSWKRERVSFLSHAVPHVYTQHIAAQNRMKHSKAAHRFQLYKSAGGDASVRNVGENLFMMGGAKPGPSNAMNGWYTKEEKAYDYNKPGFGMRTGHFSQIVWKTSARLGCAMANTGSNWYWACHFAPAGNMMGDFPSKVRVP